MPRDTTSVISYPATPLGAFYSRLDDGDASKLQRVAEAVRDKKAQQVEIIVEIGRHLLEAKAIIGHGDYGLWLRDACSFSHRTAHNYMRVAEHFGSRSKMETVSNLKAATLYTLAAPKTPEATRKAVMSMLRRNDGHSDQSVLDMIRNGLDEHKLQVVTMQFAHLPLAQQREAVSAHFAEQSALKRDKEHQLQVRLRALGKLYGTLMASNIDIEALIPLLEEAGIPDLPGMLAEFNPVPPGLRDEDGELVRGQGSDVA